MATLPPILVELKANSSELRAKLGEIQDDFKKTASEGQSMASKIKDHFGAVSTAVGGALAGAGAALSALGSKDQAAHQQLQQTIQQTGKSYDDYKDNIEQVIKANEKFGNDAASTQDAIRILTQGTGDANKAISLMATTSNLAAAQHESLATAATQMVKVYEGKGSKVLTQFGLETNNVKGAVKALDAAQKSATTADDAAMKAKQKLVDLQTLQSAKTKLTLSDHLALKNAQDNVTTAMAKAKEAHDKLTAAQNADSAAGTDQTSVLDKLGQKLSGQAAAQADTFIGRLTAMKTHVEDMAASLGQRFGPALQVSGGILMGVGQGINGVSAILDKFKGAQEAATVATEGLATAEEAEGAASTIALGPIALIIAAVVAVGVAIYELWTHWSTVWGWIKGIVSDAVGFIKDHWDQILGILLGPLGIAVDAIYRNWDRIKDGFSSVKDWIGDRVNDIVDFFVKLPGRITSAVAHAFDGLVDAFKKGVGDMLKAVPGSGIVTSVLGGIADHLPHFAAGGSIGMGQLAVVGENGPELFVPGASGTIIPNGALSGMGGSGTVNVGQIVVNGSGDPQAVAAAVRSEILRLKRSNVNGGLY